MSLKRIVEAATVSQLLKINAINKEGVRILDCSYAVGVKPDWKKFEKELYGNFEQILAQKSLWVLRHPPVCGISRAYRLVLTLKPEEDSAGLKELLRCDSDATCVKGRSETHPLSQRLISLKTEPDSCDTPNIDGEERLFWSKDIYLSGHIPEAAFFSLDAALYPSRYERFALYPPGIFEKYMQMIGINNGEHLILYSRGAIGGMMFSSKAAWLLKSYGHSPDKLSILNGGLDEWIRQKNELSTEEVQLPAGSWKANDHLAKYNIKFEELQQKDGDKAYLERTDEINFLDARVRGQFNGTEDTGLDPYRVRGSKIAGFKNTPAIELIMESGKLKSTDQIRQWLIENNYNQKQPVVTICNTGMQAAMLAHIIETAVPEASPRVYNGSMKEMELRDPKRITKGQADSSE